MNKEQYENKLRAKGYNLIGKGLYANVFAKPNSDKAIKVARTDNWPSYIYWATKSGYAGTFAPKVYSLKFHESGDFYAAIMERLVCTIGEIVGNYCHCEQVTTYHAVASYEREVCKATDLVAYVAEMRRNDFSGDMHDGNAMLRRDGQLVITDPSARDSISQSWRIKNATVCDL